MVERRTGPTPVPSLRNCTGRLPDGSPQPYGVPQPTVAEQVPNRYEWRVLWLTLAVVALGVLIGVLR